MYINLDQAFLPLVIILYFYFQTWEILTCRVIHIITGFFVTANNWKQMSTERRPIKDSEETLHVLILNEKIPHEILLRGKYKGKHDICNMLPFIF